MPLEYPPPFRATWCLPYLPFSARPKHLISYRLLTRGFHPLFHSLFLAQGLVYEYHLSPLSVLWPGLFLMACFNKLYCFSFEPPGLGLKTGRICFLDRQTDRQSALLSPLLLSLLNPYPDINSSWNSMPHAWNWKHMRVIVGLVISTSEKQWLSMSSYREVSSPTFIICQPPSDDWM